MDFRSLLFSSLSLTEGSIEEILRVISDITQGLGGRSTSCDEGVPNIVSSSPLFLSSVVFLFLSSVVLSGSVCIFVRFGDCECVLVGPDLVIVFCWLVGLCDSVTVLLGTGTVSVESVS